MNTHRSVSESTVDACLLAFVLNSLRVHLEILHQMKQIQKQDAKLQIELRGELLSKKTLKKLEA